MHARLPIHSCKSAAERAQSAATGSSSARALVELERVVRGDAAAEGQGHAQGLDGAGHRVGCVHAAAGTRARARMPHLQSLPRQHADYPTLRQSHGSQHD